ncbi:MAG: TonB family protein, partial [Bacteroidales bacterium]|nr:TonB family protein [Bacteroidales bacterium]
EDMPSFQGKGQEGFRSWIANNLRYPDIAAENGISGKVYVQFAVNSKGVVVDAVVVRGVDPALDKEASRVVMSSPKWAPGKQRGKSVKVQFTFPINFVLQ